VAVLVKVGIETDRGPWVAALAATGYEVFAIKSTMSAALRPMSEHPSDPDLTAMDQPRGTVRTPGSVGLERAAQPGYRSAAWSLSASWTVSSAAGSASKRSSGMGAPVRIDRP
jgi:hypothetical protein